jgi:ubiquinone/menaquinone biosynthesis C-methylase UbiE
MNLDARSPDERLLGADPARQYWDHRAARFNNLNWAADRSFIDFFIDCCDPRPDDQALDIGTGTGAVASKLADRARAVVGIDISPEMIKRAPRLSNAAYFQMDAVAMDFPADRFDLLTARMSFHHVEDLAAGFAEAHRVLRPGGRFVLCEGVPPDHRCRRRYVEIFKLKEKRHTFSEADLINFFDRAGFVGLTLRPFFMRQVSLKNWLENGGVGPEAREQITRLHRDAEPHFKDAYRMTFRDDDILMDWKFVVLAGLKAPR